MGGGVLYTSASYVVYSHREGIVLYVLGVINPQSDNPVPVMLHLTFEYANLQLFSITSLQYQQSEHPGFSQ